MSFNIAGLPLAQEKSFKDAIPTGDHGIVPIDQGQQRAMRAH
ncbi:hypothetical protein CPTB_01429 [Corynebacterium pseudotuberculosis]|nr:hypothetical protein CPTA_00098 [Corynebacterium pseudotuberculosis]AIG09485.1 hypothetical protein CPTB_01429 [Corynebacterium pseudotuberculosis]AIG11387.1 hypothetical protein CPTC_01099 [Corynebacterium pseudotuberculosis]